MLLVSGSIALDTLEGPYGRAENELGGSALYFALAGSLIAPVAVVACVGRADEAVVRDAVAGRDIDLSGLDVLDAPTFSWHAQDVEGANVDLGREDSIYDRWSPRVPDGFGGWAFAGSMRPQRQVDFLERVPHAALRAGDAMLSYTRAAPAEFERILALSDWFFANDAELGALHGGEPEEFRRSHGLQGLCVKAGPRGARVYTEGGEVHVPAITSRPAVDTTGAGDALAAGFLARRLTAPEAGLRDALAHGVALASITIEDVGLRAIRRATPATLAERLAEVPA